MNRKEYNKAVDQYSGRLYGYSLKFLKNEADASDIVQDVFEKLWTNRKKVDFEKSKSWLFTSAHNAMINMVKRHQRTKVVYADQMIVNYSVIDDRFEWKEIVNQLFDDLPKVQKSILLLRDLEGYDYKEIANILELNESQVKVYLFRARKKIKMKLEQLMILA